MLHFKVKDYLARPQRWETFEAKAAKKGIPCHTP